MGEITVFYHMGGVMMDDEAKRRQWENDPEGWYFWSGARNGRRHLHGPYESQELADYERTARV
jgi:hypothetical protein